MSSGTKSLVEMVSSARHRGRGMSEVGQGGLEMILSGLEVPFQTHS